jgi:hypothetical protein
MCDQVQTEIKWVPYVPPKVEDHLFVTPLYKASLNGDLSKMKELLDNGAKVNETNLVGDYDWPGDGAYQHHEGDLSPLYGAIIGGHTAAVQLLIEHKADVNQRGNEYSYKYPLIAAGSLLSNIFTYEGPRPDTPIIAGDPPRNLKEINEYMAKKEELDKNGICPPEWLPLVAKEIKYQDIISLLMANGAQLGFDDLEYKQSTEAYFMRGAPYSRTRGLTSYVIDQGDGAICYLKQLFKYRKDLMAKGYFPANSEAIDDINFIKRMIVHAEHGIVASTYGINYTYPIKNTYLLHILRDIASGKSSIDNIGSLASDYKLDKLQIVGDKDIKKKRSCW